MPNPVEKTRRGESIRLTPLRRVIFVGGLVGALILPLLMALWADASHLEASDS